MFELFASIGGFGFFIVMVLVIVAGVISAEFDSIIGAVATFVFLAGVAVFMGYWPSMTTIAENLLMIFAGLVAYIVVGLVYGVWYRYAGWLKSRKGSIQNEYERFVVQYTKKNNGEYPSNDEFRDSSYYSRYTPLYNADKIATWVALWPWAGFWDLCHKPIRFVYNTAYDIAAKALVSVSRRISDKIISDVIDKK